jgi:DUF4097 and DUF4098 domain-containing protein YvlB
MTDSKIIGKRIGLWIGICLLLFSFSSGVFAQEITGKAGEYKTTFKKEFSVSPGGELEMKDITGNVTVNTWDKNMVQITEKLKMDVYTKGEAEEIVNRSKSRYSESGNTVTVTGVKGRRSVYQNFEVFVPNKFDLDINTSGGDLTIGSLTGKLVLKTSGGDIKLDKIEGDVQAKTSGGDLDFESIKGSLTASTSGGSIKLGDVSGEADVSTSGGDITVTKADNNIKVSTSGGDLDISQISGDFTGKTSGGSIIVSDCSGNVNVKTSGGNLKLNDIKGKLTGSTSGGDIDGRGFLAPVDVRTSGGDVEIFDVKGPITAKTSGGNMDVEITLEDFSKPHAIELRTSGGDINLTLPAGFPASVIAEISLGKDNRYRKRYDIFSDFPLSKTETEEKGNKIIRSQGDINGGGDKVYLRTSGGNINIKKK